MIAAALLLACAQEPALPFERLGRALLATADEARAGSAADSSVLTRLEPLHERIALGAVELWIPRRVVEADGSLHDGPKPKDVADEVAGLVALERAWLERATDDETKLRAAGDALGRVAPLLAKARAFPLEAPSAERLAARTALEQLFFDAPTTNGRSELVVVLAPSRAQFVALLGAGGLVYQQARELYWIDSARDHVFHWLDFDASVVAQTVAPEPRGEPALQDVAMLAEVATQWVVHGASHALSARFAAGAPPWFGEALAIGDTISSLGADETLCSGAAPPAARLDLAVTALAWVTLHASPYRGRASSKWFAKELKGARSRDGLLVVDLQREREAFRVPPPLLGAASTLPSLVDTAPLGAKQGYAEMFRAYSTAFVHWLDTAEGARERLLPRLMRELRARGKHASLHEVARELGARTLGASGDPQLDLEAAFGAWLAR